MKRAAALLLALGIVAGWMAIDALPAQAQVTVYGNETDYNNATGAQIFLIDFNGSTGAFVDGGSFSGEVTFGSPEAEDPTLVNWNSDAISDAGSTSSPTNVGPIDGVFTTPVRAFALVFLSAGEAETVHMFDEGGALIASVLAPNASGFFGVVSATPIKSFFLENGLFPNGNRDRFFIDDFRANEPASADVNGCPPAFDRTIAEPGVPSGFADRNGDGFACRKDLNNGRTVWIDNNVPDNTASGVTDAGSSVLVDTNTGDVLSG